MTNDWSDRQRNTNALARSLAKYIFQQDDVSASQLYGLSKLAWITNSYDGDNPSYVTSTKIPALGDALGVDFGRLNISQVAQQIVQIVGDRKISPLVTNHTGFTNFYKAYRNSVRDWITTNSDKLLPMFQQAYRASSNKKRLALVRQIADMPGIPKANHPTHRMRPENFLTPAFFVLDPNVHFPLINGNENVLNVLTALNVANASLEDKYQAMVRLYKVDGIQDAADLDQVGRDMPEDIEDLISSRKKPARKRILRPRSTNELRDLPLKGELDISAMLSARTVKFRRIHNQLTNKLVSCLGGFRLLEGADNSCMFDVLVKNYDTYGKDLLVEVKSSCDTSQVRLAVGQLFDYWLNLKGNLDDPHLAVVLPEKPMQSVMAFLNAMEIGLMWFESNTLSTKDDWLRHLVEQAG